MFREYILEIPELEDLYNNKIEASDFIERAANINESLSQMVNDIVEYKMMPFLLKHPEITTVLLDVDYEYNDEGYSPRNVMPWFNDNWDLSDVDEEMDDLRNEVDGLFDDMGALLSFNIYINTPELISKYNSFKLDKDLSVKEVSKGLKNKL